MLTAPVLWHDRMHEGWTKWNENNIKVYSKYLPRDWLKIIRNFEQLITSHNTDSARINKSHTRLPDTGWRGPTNKCGGQFLLQTHDKLLLRHSLYSLTNVYLVVCDHQISSISTTRFGLCKPQHNNSLKRLGRSIHNSRMRISCQKNVFDRRSVSVSQKDWLTQKQQYRPTRHHFRHSLTSFAIDKRQSLNFVIVPESFFTARQTP